MPDEGISPEIRMLAADAIERARRAPRAGDIREMERDALRADGGDMSPAEIRRLAATAAAQAQQVSALMGRLADLLGASPDGLRG